MAVGARAKAWRATATYAQALLAVAGLSILSACLVLSRSRADDAPTLRTLLDAPPLSTPREGSVAAVVHPAGHVAVRETASVAESARACS